MSTFSPTIDDMDSRRLSFKKVFHINELKEYRIPNTAIKRKSSASSSDADFGSRRDTVTIDSTKQMSGIARSAQLRSASFVGSTATLVADREPNDLCDKSKRNSAVTLESCESIKSHVTLPEMDLIAKDKPVVAALLCGLSIMSGAGSHQMPKFARNVLIDASSRDTIMKGDLGHDGKIEPFEIKVYDCESFLQLTSQLEFLKMLNLFSSGIVKTGAGKSGSDMYWSADRKFIAKTLSPIEVKKGRQLIPKLTNYHLEQPNSLLIKYLALIRIKLQKKQPIYISIMPNINDGFVPSMMFDIKGSTHGRAADLGVLMYKDLDFLAYGTKLAFPTLADKNEFLMQLHQDVLFLSQNHRIDYSLLVGFSKHGTWRVGIIDILTPFSKRKTLEYLVMGSMYGYSAISCSPPKRYATRFVDFVAKSCFCLS